MKRTLTMIFAVSLLLVGCGSNETTPQVRDATGTYLLNDWGEAIVNDADLENAVATDDNYRVFYEIFVGSFSDSDGDGIGDLQGIINRMDYLNDGDDNSGVSLGVEGLWLSPIFKSGSYHKYDVNDYYTIDPKFGTEEDLRELIELCHERNVKVILDLVINHTGTLNPWFISFLNAHRNGDTDDPYYDFYDWYPTGETAPAGRTYAQLSGTTDYYECNFSNSMPELNYDNDAVRQAVLDVAKYYLDLGIDGFRFDAAKYIYYGDNVQSAAFWEWYIGELKSIKPDIYTVAEVWDSDGITDLYYPALNCFNFTTSQTNGLIAQTAQAGNVNNYTAYVQSYLDKVNAMNDTAMIIPFISNHDMDRAAGYLTAASGQMKMAANLYILSSGSPFIYYGEEIGLRGSRGGANTDANRRLRMEWGDDDTVRDPEGADYSSTRVSANAIEQMADGNSLYTYYKKLIMIRKANPAICRGTYTALAFTGTKLGGFISTYEGTTVAVLHNPSGSAITVDLSAVTDVEFTKINAAIGAGGATLDGSTLTLDSQTSVVLGCD
ncbi:MAG: hypothetical protein J1E03_13230 [Acetatifactor sp.]|nr:hypothetical protein [Acetatifactor sp.]